MKTQIQKWGNSLALRIPRSFAQEMGLAHDVPVNLTLVGNRLIITPEYRFFTLEELLDGITSENLHNEVDIGSYNQGRYDDHNIHP
jgi:antitoxin MazE